MEKIDYAIVGGGIIGFSLAKNLIAKHPEASIVIFEKEKYLGDHTSGRNSGVLHAGIYYEQGSLKQKGCLEGNFLWEDWAKELNIPIKLCGKFIIAQSPQHQSELENLFKQAKLNSVSGIRRATKTEINNLSEHLHLVDAIYSPRSGIIDLPVAMSNLRYFLETKDVITMLSTKVHTIVRDSANDGFILYYGEEKIWAQNLINAAGLYGVDLRKQLDLFELENYFVKGNYLKSTQKKICDYLVYPTPEKNLKGLGVHLTLDMQDQMKFGPNTEDVSEINYKVNESVQEQMLPQIQAIFKTVDTNKLSLDYAGIRPKLKLNGEVYKDFWIKGPIKNYFEFLGIESPGATAAPAIGKLIP